LAASSVGSRECPQQHRRRGLWDEEDGFYYDQLKLDGKSVPLKLRGMMGLVPLLAIHILATLIDRRLCT
jgi:hypothetical protein